MSAERLREAAARIRAEQTIEHALGHIDDRERDTWLAMADLLDFHARTPLSISRALLKVVDCYLGASS